MAERPTLAEMVAPLRDAFAVAGTLTVAFGDCVVRLESDNASLVAELRDYYRHCVVGDDTAPGMTVIAMESMPLQLDLTLRAWPREPGKEGRKETFAELVGGRVVHKVRTGMVFLFGAEERWAVGPCAANANQIVNFINAQHLVWLLDRGWVNCHAAAVVRGERGLAIAGTSGGGKSTLALHLLGDSIAFCSNDRLLVHASAGATRMAGIAKQPRINPGTALNNPRLVDILTAERRAALQHMSDAELWDLEEKYDVDVLRVFPEAGWRMTAPLVAFVVLDWDRGCAAPTGMRRIDLAARRDLLRAIMKSPGPFHLPTVDLTLDEDAYLRHLRDTPVWCVSGGVDFEHAAGACQALLAGGEPAA